jgi:FAD:protein FMN transferase
VDARTGWPARGVASATVIAASAFRAGQFATAAFLFGAADGLALLEETPGVEGALITEEGTILPTTGMRFLSDLPGSAWPAHVYF